MRSKALRLLLAVLLAVGLGTGALAAETARQPALVQVGVIDALLAGGYEGSLGLTALRGLGDFGLGTFDALDGEMVVLDGVVYQVPFSGQVRKAPMNLTTPFAQVLRFRPQAAVALPPQAGLKDVEALLDGQLGDANVFAAARIDAGFARLTARSVPRQTPPYRPLAEVAKEQAVFRFETVKGTLVGLRGPAFAKGMGVPGWHWHFLTTDRTRGGHVLEFALDAGQAKAGLMVVRRMELLLPRAGLAGLDLARDRARELHAVESGK